MGERSILTSPLMLIHPLPDVIQHFFLLAFVQTLPKVGEPIQLPAGESRHIIDFSFDGIHQQWNIGIGLVQFSHALGHKTACDPPWCWKDGMRLPISKDQIFPVGQV